MKKIIYIFILLLPIILFSCSGSSNEADLKKQLEIAEQKNQELIQKENALANYFVTNSISYSDWQLLEERSHNESTIKNYLILFQLYSVLVQNFSSDYSGGSNLEYGYFCFMFTEIHLLKLTDESCWKVDNNLNTYANNQSARQVESCLFGGWCFPLVKEEEE